MAATLWYNKLLADMRAQGFSIAEVPLDEAVSHKYHTLYRWHLVAQNYLVSGNVKFCMLVLSAGAEYRVLVAREWYDLTETQFRHIYTNVHCFGSSSEFNSLDLVLKASAWPRRGT